MTPRPFSFHDLPIEAFPVEIFVYGHDGELLWKTDPPIEPYVAVEIPSFRGKVAFTVMRFGDGELLVSNPARTDAV